MCVFPLLDFTLLTQTERSHDDAVRDWQSAFTLPTTSASLPEALAPFNITFNISLTLVSQSRNQQQTKIQQQNKT